MVKALSSTHPTRWVIRMDVKNRAVAIESCEGVLREEYRYNVESEIWPIINERILRLLTRTHELSDAYCELCIGRSSQRAYLILRCTQYHGELLAIRKIQRSS